ncbi:hypothetical protein AURDEDRAFT_176122 [Auricularia subglabra TFB-10046 SS5]|uniref:Uncharacterized protein n=1 Tax=Auricularia subglabra (strain TFB-10046 / SS5) TaxID=717982 RepID=J0WQL0_AURST|nr:hypothetical protein AURDEDRAFT_176122 [Auricularia subglabra TFB-10046 SS5]
MPPTSLALQWNGLRGSSTEELMEKWEKNPLWFGHQLHRSLDAFSASMFEDFRDKYPETADADPEGWTNSRLSHHNRSIFTTSEKAMETLFPPQKKRRATGARYRFAAAHKDEIDRLFNERKGEDEKQSPGMRNRLWHSIVAELISNHAEEYEALKEKMGDDDEDDNDPRPLPDPVVVASFKGTVQHILDWWAVHTGFTFVLGVVGNDGQDDVVACYDDKISNFLGSNPALKQTLEEALVAHVLGNRDVPQPPQFVPSRDPSLARAQDQAQGAPPKDTNEQDAGNEKVLEDAMETQTTSWSPTPDVHAVSTPAPQPEQHSSFSLPPPLSPPPVLQDTSSSLKSTPQRPADQTRSTATGQVSVDPEVVLSTPLAAEKEAILALVAKTQAEKWMTKDLGFFLDSSDSPGWIGLIRAWVRYEKEHLTHKERLISDYLRPNVYKVFWTRNCWTQPSDDDLNTFHSDFIAWYVSLQPDARKAGGITRFIDLKPADIVDKGVYGNLYLSGGRGIVVILFGIAWLLRAGARIPVCSAQSAATADTLVSDVKSIISVLCTRVGDNGLERRCAGVPGPQHAGPSRNNKRKEAPESDEDAASGSRKNAKVVGDAKGGAKQKKSGIEAEKGEHAGEKVMSLSWIVARGRGNYEYTM